MTQATLHLFEILIFSTYRSESPVFYTRHLNGFISIHGVSMESGELRLYSAQFLLTRAHGLASSCVAPIRYTRKLGSKGSPKKEFARDVIGDVTTELAGPMPYYELCKKPAHILYRREAPTVSQGTSDVYWHKLACWVTEVCSY